MRCKGCIIGVFSTIIWIITGSAVKNEASRWFSEALWDLETAEILHREKRYNASAFYSHQAPEKTCKALLYNVNEVPFRHSVRELFIHRSIGSLLCFTQ
ncbi:MAG: HEPN domain-containing protein [Desulfurococcaceae archaeon]